MGSAVGRVLGLAGYNVVTTLAGRSAESRELAAAAGIRDLGSLEGVIRECDVFLSILPPAVAAEFSARAAAIIETIGREITYVDCNAVAPATLTNIAAHFAGGPARFLDVGIVGPAPRVGAAKPTRFYVAGADRDLLLALAVPQIEMHDMGQALGRASAIKMCYAAMNKGVDALFANLLLAARRLGVEDELMRELEASQSESAARMVRRIPYLAATAARFSGEMAEIAAAFDAAGVSGDFYRGAEWLYGVLARSSLAGETRATLPDHRTLEAALEAYAAALDG